MKKKFYLEVHQYAPEMNQLRFFGISKAVGVGGIFSIKEAKRKLFAQVRPKRVAEINVTVPSHPYLDRSYCGVVNNYSEVKEFCKNLKTHHNLPGTVFKVKTKMVYLESLADC